jgi:hypothetical protein
VPSQPDRAMDLRLGDYFLQDAGTTPAIHSDGTTKLELVAFELK